MKRLDQIHLEQVLDEPLRFESELVFPAASLGREPVLEISPVRFEGEIARVERGYALQARVAYAGKLECSRCLAPYPFQKDEEFSLLLYKRGEVADPELALGKSDLDVSYYQEPVLPIAPIAEERIQLAIPMKPLCREDCRGLCPRCGKDLNVTTCDCSSEVADPRWQPLKAWKKV